MRDCQSLPRDPRTTARWITTIALLLVGCLNPRPEELPSAQGLDGAGDPGLGDGNENAAVVPGSAPPAPASPGGSVDLGDDDPSPAPTGNPDSALPPPDGGTSRADAGAPDAGD